MAKEMKDEGITLASVNKRVDDLAAMVKGINEKVDRHSVNHVNHVVKYHNARLDKGATKLGQVGLIALFALGMVCVSDGATIPVENWNKSGAVGKIERDTSANKITLTIDNLIVSNSVTISGAISTNSVTDIRASGTDVKDRLTIVLPAITTTTITNGYGDLQIESLTASNRVVDNTKMRIKFVAKGDTTGTVSYATIEAATADVTAASKDGSLFLRTFVAGIDKIAVGVNSNANAKVTLGLVTKFDKPFEVPAASISNAAYAVGSVNASVLAAASVGGSEYIAASISNVAIAASAAIAASKLGFDPVVSKTGADANMWTGQIRLTAAGTNTYVFTSKGITSTNGLVLMCQYWSTVPTVATNHLSATSVTTNTALIKGEPSEEVKIVGVQ